MVMVMMMTMTTMMMVVMVGDGDDDDGGDGGDDVSPTSTPFSLPRTISISFLPTFSFVLPTLIFHRQGHLSFFFLLICCWLLKHTSLTGKVLRHALSAFRINMISIPQEIYDSYKYKYNDKYK